MWNRRAAASALLGLAVVLAGACSDLPPTEPLAFDQEVSLFGGPASERPVFTNNLDNAFLRIAREHPGFGGLFYGPDGALNIVAAGVRPLSLPALGPSLSRLGVELAAQPVNVVEGRYDFIELDAMRQSVTAVLELRGVVFTDADEARNRVVVGVEDAAAAAAVERAVAMLGLPEGAVIVEQTAPYELDQSLRDHVRPVGGGLQVAFDRAGSTFVCTLGFNVSSVGGEVLGFVNNSHCSRVRSSMQSTPYWQPSRVAANFIGEEVHDLPFFTGSPCPAGRVCRYSDSLGGRYEPGVNVALGAIYRTLFPGTTNPGSLEIDPANPRWEIVAELPYPMIGQTLHKTGRTSGWTMGPVTGTCLDINLSPNITLFCQDRLTTLRQGGDSGSPYYERIGETNQVRLAGVHWGGSGFDAIMSSINNIRCENEGPAPWITFPGQDPPGTPACTR